jgi:hypothetical protein
LRIFIKSFASEVNDQKFVSIINKSRTKRINLIWDFKYVGGASLVDVRIPLHVEASAAGAWRLIIVLGIPIRGDSVLREHKLLRLLAVAGVVFIDEASQKMRQFVVVRNFVVVDDELITGARVR